MENCGDYTEKVKQAIQNRNLDKDCFLLGPLLSGISSARVREYWPWPVEPVADYWPWPVEHVTAVSGPKTAESATCRDLHVDVTTPTPRGIPASFSNEDLDLLEQDRLEQDRLEQPRFS